MGEFEQQFKMLNAAQKEAVEALEGPVLVIAGPGTGKTQLLSMRVANIMRQRGVDASNILCLTFTNKAALNMRDRLLLLAGAESTKVNVRTFHGFAAEVMNNYPDYFWNGARLITAPDAIQLEIVQNILSRLPLSNPLSIRFAGQFTATDDVIKALRLAKEAGLTPEKLRAILEANLAYINLIEPQLAELLNKPLNVKKLSELETAVNDIPEQGIDTSIAPLVSLTTVIKEGLQAAIKADEGTGKTKSTGKWKARWIQNLNDKKGVFDERRRTNWWLAFCDVYTAYRDELHTRGYYDYSDMLLEVIVQFEQNPDLLATVQERYQYVLIDEFQDSNAAQLRLAHLVADHYSAEGRPNLMAVGDDDQSIYGFTGAELNNMLFFERNYSKVKQIVLAENYRSTQEILDAVARIIEQADDRLVNRIAGISKHLIASNPPEKKGEIAHFQYKTKEHQYSEIARHIQKKWKRGHGQVAVLARGHESLKMMSKVLLKLGVPVRYEHQSNILEHEAVKQILLIAELLEAISSGQKDLVNEKLANLIKHPMWSITPEEQWKLAVDNFSNPDWLSSLRQSKIENQKQLGDWLLWLAGKASSLPLRLTFEHILGLVAGEHMTSPIRRFYLRKSTESDDYLQSLSAVSLLQHVVSEFAVTNEEPSIADFTRFVKINQENGRGITDESVFVSSREAVELYTVHKAKGLEFDEVYIVDAVESSWRPRMGGRKPPANLPLQPPGEKDDDYIRLMYVAASRARHSLIISSYKFDSVGEEVLASPIVRQAISETTTPEPSIDDIQVLEETLSWPRLKPTEEKANLLPRLENYQLSPTHFLDFLDTASGGPQHYLERHLLRLPEAKTAQQAYGNAMHNTMQYAQQLVNQDKLDLKKILNWYAERLSAEQLLQEDSQKYLLHGQETLKRLFGELDLQLEKGGQAEQFMNDIRVDQATICGIIDKLDKPEESVIITDYKTGQPLVNFMTKDKTKAIKAWRHRSQLIFYALLLKNSATYSQTNNITGRMIYLEAETQKDLIKPYVPSQEEIRRMGRLINAVWRKIHALDFPDAAVFTPDIEGIRRFEEDLLNGQ